MSTQSAVTNTTNPRDGHSEPAVEPSTGDDLLTLAEVRQRCRIGKTTLYRKLKEYGIANF